MAQDNQSDNSNQQDSRTSLLGFLGIAVLVVAPALYLGLESTRNLSGVPQRHFLAVAHWFDPVFFQYNLILVVLAVLVVPAVLWSYIANMAKCKMRKLYKEIPNNFHAAIVEHFSNCPISVKAYFRSVLLATVVVLLGASILLLFKPVPRAELLGVDFSLGANVLMMGPYIELFGNDQKSYFIHLTRSLTAFQFGFLGAYVYFITSLARAYFTFDLTPHTFIEGTIRMIAASIMALVLSFLSFFHGGGPTVGLAALSDVPLGFSSIPVVSFTVGFFPGVALYAIMHSASRFLKVIKFNKYRALPLSQLAGISYFHEMRLEREGIDNIENFSVSDPVFLALRTGFSYQQLAQWISEAWLIAHLREDYPEFVRRSGITSREEFQAFLVKTGGVHAPQFASWSDGLVGMKGKLIAIGELLE